MVLAVTGVWTWLIRRRKKRRKRRSGSRRGRRRVSGSLARTVALYAGGLALFSLFTAARGRGLGRAHAGAAVVLGLGAALDALVAGAAVLAGERPAEPVPFAGYLLLSVLAMPAGWGYAAAPRAAGTPPRSRSRPARSA